MQQQQQQQQSQEANIANGNTSSPKPKIWKNIVLLIVALLINLTTSGTILGWPNIVVILRQLGKDRLSFFRKFLNLLSNVMFLTFLLC
jgi:hypothetical protein